jgi:hypothetical protein
VVAFGEEGTALRWSVDAPVLAVPPRPPIACWTIQLSYPPAGGYGVEVRGLDPRTVPGAHVYNNGTVLTPTLRLTGGYDGCCLTLSEPASPVQLPDSREVPARGERGTGCPDPGGGSFTAEQREAALAYAAAQLDLGEVWLSDAERVLNVSFTSSLARHEQAIRAVYPGPLCVVEAPISAGELDTMQRRLHADPDLEAHRIQVLQSGPSGGKLHILVVAAGPDQVRLLQDRYGPRVVVTSWLRPVPPD